MSTGHAKIDEFFAGLKKQAARTKGFMAILEVCGFNHWLLKKLEEFGCKEIVLMQPDKTSNKKTDRRDANALCELLWNNRTRLKNGEHPNGIRRITVPTQAEAETRQLANLRQYFVKQRTKCINKIRGLLRKHNMEQDAPSNNFKTKKVRDWLKQLKLTSTVDRLEIDAHLNFLEECSKQILKMEHEMATRAVARQYLGRFGKVDNGQVGTFLAYVTRKEHVLVNAKLFIPQEWNDDPERCRRAKIPPNEYETHKTRHEHCLEMLDEQGELLPHKWITGDDELGKSSWFRWSLRNREERYVLAVPCNTNSATSTMCRNIRVMDRNRKEHSFALTVGGNNSSRRIGRSSTFATAKKNR